MNLLDQDRLETTDIFKGAFFLARGGKLVNVRIKENTRKTVSFLFELEDIAVLDKDYRRGEGYINASALRDSLNHLRDILFDKLRDPASCEHYAEVKRRMRYDREREDRRAQKEH